MEPSTVERRREDVCVWWQGSTIVGRAATVSRPLERRNAAQRKCEGEKEKEEPHADGCEGDGGRGDLIVVGQKWTKTAEFRDHQVL